MQSRFTTEAVLAIALIVLLIFVANPFGQWMPDPVLMLVCVFLAIAVALFAGLVWRERALDEREEQHRAIAGRYAYIAGLLILVVGIIVQSARHQLDSWLVLALGVMVFIKEFTRLWYGARK